MRCFACGHRCLIPPGPRRHLPGPLQRRAARCACPFGYVGGAAARPDREEALLPRAARARRRSPSACSAATTTAATARTGSPRRRCAIPRAVAPPSAITPEQLVRARPARTARRIVTSTYNEPLITSEWAVAVFKRGARPRGSCARTSRTATAPPEVLDYLRPWVSLYKVDLKGFRRPALPRAGRHARARARHDPRAPRAGLLGRGRDAGRAGLQRLRRGAAATSRASWSRVSPDIPWHVTAFHPDYKMTDRPRDVGRSRCCARPRSARGRGPALRLRRQPAGAPCAAARTPTARAVVALLVERLGYRILSNRMGASGRCPDCRQTIPGVWGR